MHLIVYQLLSSYIIQRISRFSARTIRVSQPTRNPRPVSNGQTVIYLGFTSIPEPRPPVLLCFKVFLFISAFPFFSPFPPQLVTLLAHLLRTHLIRLTSLQCRLCSFVSWSNEICPDFVGRLGAKIDDNVV